MIILNRANQNNNVNKQQNKANAKQNHLNKKTKTRFKKQNKKKIDSGWA
jgi:hypothetical protein